MRRLAAMVVVLFLLPAASAWGQSTVAKDAGGVVTVTGSASNDAVSVSLAANAVTVTITDTGGITANAGCAAAGATTVTCGGATTTAINADLLGGDDGFSADATVTVPLAVVGGLGDDVLSGGGGPDRLDGGEGADLLSGAQGQDSLDGGSGDDVMSGGAESDEIRGEAGHDVLSGDDGDDRLFAGAGDDEISGGAGADHAEGGDGDDLVNGEAGDDDVLGGAGGDELSGGAGNDAVHGDAGNDVVNGDAGSDTLAGDDGDDLMLGGDGDDVVSGGVGADLMSGGPRDDLLDGGPGADAMDGDQGIDTTSYAGRSAPVTVTLGNGLADDGEQGEGDNVGFGVENVNGGSGDDVLVGSGAVNVMTCGAGADTAIVDPADTSAADCETVTRPAPPPSVGDAAQAPPAAPAPLLQPPSVARPRATPSLRVQIAPKRDRRAPYSYKLIGRVRVPVGLDPALACGDPGLVSIEVKRGAATLLSLRPRLRADCTFAARITFKGPKRLRTTKLRLTASFLGNAYLSPMRAKSSYVRAG